MTRSEKTSCPPLHTSGTGLSAFGMVRTCVISRPCPWGLHGLLTAFTWHRYEGRGGEGRGRGGRRGEGLTRAAVQEVQEGLGERERERGYDPWHSLSLYASGREEDVSEGLGSLAFLDSSSL